MDPEIVDTPTDTTAADQDDQAGFLDGFKDDGTPTALPPEAAGTDETDETPPQYVQLTKQEYDEIKARAALIEEIRATQDKSFGTLGGTIRSIRQDLDSLKSGKRVDIDQADIDALREDFPPLAAALEKVRDLQVIGGAAIDQDAIGALVDKRADEKVGAYKQRVESRFLSMTHPDWKTYSESPEFSAWVGAQPAEFQQQLAQASDAWDSDFISDAMTKAKAASKKPAPQADDASTRRSRMSAAVTPRGSGSASAGTTDDDDFNAGFKTG